MHSTNKDAYKNVVKYYDQKHFKRSLKFADAILRQSKAGGSAKDLVAETYSMKALNLNALNRKKEAYVQAREGLKVDVRNQVCWHALGSLYRSDRKWLDAAKCFENALLNYHQGDKNQLLREIASVHIQNRSYDAFVKISYSILREKQTNQSNWMAFAVACHLAGDSDKAVKVIEEFALADKNKKDKDPYEHGEMLLFANAVVERSKSTKEALAHLISHEKEIVDKEELKILKGKYFLKLLDFENADKIYRTLIKGNPDNEDYHVGFLKANKFLPLNHGDNLPNSVNLDESTESKLLGTYDTFLKEYPGSKNTLHLVTFHFITGKLLKERFEQFFHSALTKGVPGLFNLVKFLYLNPSKDAIISEVVFEAEKKLLASNKLKDSDKEEEPPTTILWLNYYISQYYSYIKKDTQKALLYSKKCIDHTPTVLDFEILNARIYKHAGDAETASKHMEEARTYDLADRNLNTKSTRFLLRADKIKEAEEIISLFTKTDVETSTHNNILDMQVMWYEQEEGESWIRQNQYGKALKRFVDIIKHFQDIYADQFDFHSYCPKKVTLRQYLQMLDFEDSLTNHPFYVKAASSIIKCYLHLYHNPKPSSIEEDPEFQKLSEEEKKKFIRKKKKEEAIKRKEEEERKELQASLIAKGKIPRDDDPNGEKLLKVDPISEANTYVQLIKKANNFEAQLLSFEVFLLRKKYLLALKSLIKAHNLSPSHPELHVALVKYFHEVSKTEGLNPVVKEAISKKEKELVKSDTQSLTQYVAAYFKENENTVAGRLAHYKASLILSLDTKDNLKKNLIQIEDPGFPLNECISVHKLLLADRDLENATQYKQKCQQRFPNSTYFKDRVEPTPETKSEPKPEQ